MPVAFLDLAQHCAPQISVETLAAIVSVESGFQPFTIRINSDYPLAEQPTTSSDAIATATMLIAEGHDIALGLSGINSDTLGRLGLSVSDTFDLCRNLSAGATLLDGYRRQAVQAGATADDAETAMLQAYFGNGDASLGQTVGYDRQVLDERARLSGHLEDIQIDETQTMALPDGGGAGGQPVLPVEFGSTGTEPHRLQDATPRWDVFNSGRQSSVLVFSNGQQE